jgi:hypothetical protein
MVGPVEPDVWASSLYGSRPGAFEAGPDRASSVLDYCRRPWMYVDSVHIGNEPCRPLAAGL